MSSPYGFRLLKCEFCKQERHHTPTDDQSGYREYTCDSCGTTRRINKRKACRETPLFETDKG